MARVAMVVSNRYDPDPRVQKEAASLVAAGHEVDVYAFDRVHDKALSEETIEGVAVHRLVLGRFPYGNLVATAVGMPRFLGAVRERLRRRPPDVVHCHDQDTCPVGLWWQRRGAREVGTGARGRFVYDAHDFYWTFVLMNDEDALWRRAAARLLEAREQRYAARADLMLTVTEAIDRRPGTAEWYRERGHEPVVLWNAPRAVASPPPLPERFTLGYFGTIREPAMFRWLVAAIERLPAPERPALRVAGHGTAQAEVRELLEQAGRSLALDVEVGGGFGMEDIGRLMAECSVQFCVYPGHSGNVARSLPVKLLDAVAHGRLVIGNSRMLMSDWIEQEQWGFVVDEGDIAGLAAVISAARQRLSSCGTTPPVLSPPPTWEAQAAKLVDAYERLLCS